MEFGEKDIRKLLIMSIVLVLAVLTFLIIRPVIIAIFGGLVLAYICMPLYRKLYSYTRSGNISSTIVSVVVILAIIVPLWFVIPILVSQTFEIFKASQGIDVQGIVSFLFPTGSEQFIVQLTVSINSLISKLSSLILNSLVDVFLNIPQIALGLFIAATVFFCAMKYNEELSEFSSAISPFNKSKEKIIVKQFKDVTDSIIYGQIIVGLVQGILAGLGFLMFGVDNALALTALAIFLSILPHIGPGLVYLPVGIFFIASGNVGVGVAFLLYNFLVVSTVDNFLRIYIVSKKTDLSAVFALIGTIGGLFVFGIMGLILGPLIIAYFITFLKAYKEKNLSSLFSDGN